MNDPEKRTGSLTLCGQSNCKGRQDCTRWVFRNRKSGGFILMSHAAGNASECEWFVPVDDIRPWIVRNSTKGARFSAPGGNSKQRRKARRQATRNGR